VFGANKQFVTVLLFFLSFGSPTCRTDKYLLKRLFAMFLASDVLFCRDAIDFVDKFLSVGNNKKLSYR